MTDSTQSAVIRAYLVDLYGETPQGLLWIGGHADGWRGRTFAQVDGAVAYAVQLDARGGLGVYHRSTTLARAPERRGEASDSHMVHYFALDADVRGEGHKAENLPESLDDVRSLIEGAGFPPPTCWVSSGGGFYPQWRFSEPIDVREGETRTWVQEAFAAMAAHFIAVAKVRGWHLDNVRDLARVFRLPGTTNRKVGEVTASVIEESFELFDLGVLASIANRARTREVSSAPPPADSDLFDDADRGERRFTEAQALEYLGRARARLAATEAGFNTAINNFAMECAHFPWLVDQERCGRNMILALGPKTGWTEPDAADLATIRSAYSATEAGKSWVAVRVETPSSELPPPSRPLDVARDLVERIPTTDGHAHRTWWRDDFYSWTGTHWEADTIATVEKWLYRETGDATYKVADKVKEGAEQTYSDLPWAPTRKKIGDLVHALGVGELQREGDEDRITAMANGVLVGRELLPHSPSRFNLSSLPFAYDPNAKCPMWLDFLESTLPGDVEAHQTIAEWFGYVLGGGTGMHKIGVLVGPPRCGKGTISRVLQAMVGPAGWAAPTLARLATDFGLESMIGKSLAVMGDVRWTSKHVIDAVPVMLGISGEDGFSIGRKHKGDWIGTLGTRLMLMSNDAPTFTDASGALAGRMVYVAFRRSFLGREDLGLGQRLMTELPGILNWALDGLDELTARGRFTQSATSLELREEVDRDSSPVAAWVDDRCVLDPSATFTLDALLSSYRDWLTAENLAFSPSLNRLSRELRSAFGDKGVEIVRKSDGHGGKHRLVTGIRPIAGGSIPGADLFDNAQ